MLGYVMLGSNDLEKAKAYYDEVLKPLGAVTMFEHHSGGRVYSSDGGVHMLGVVGPFDGEAASAGNGTMIALKADTHDAVRQVHARAIELGGTDEGAPGWRGEPGQFYGGYFRDLDGNKLCVYRIGPE